MVEEVDLFTFMIIIMIMVVYSNGKLLYKNDIESKMKIVNMVRANCDIVHEGVFQIK